jgi:hypothetical protein
MSVGIVGKNFSGLEKYSGSAGDIFAARYLLIKMGGNVFATLSS